MSVKELKFEMEDKEGYIIIKFKDDNRLYFTDSHYGEVSYSRSEAHSLMLYLQEHLGYISTTEEAFKNSKII